MGIPVFVAASTILCLIEEDEGRHKFGQPGGVDFASEINLFQASSCYILFSLHLLLQNPMLMFHVPTHCAGFHCPWVPALPIGSILVNVYLLVNLGYVI